MNDSTENYIDHDLYQGLRLRYEPQQGEILLSKDATPGIAHYLEKPVTGIISSGILRLKIIDDIPPHFLEIILNSLIVQLRIERDAGGSIMLHWKPSEKQRPLIPRISSNKEIKIAALI